MSGIYKHFRHVRYEKWSYYGYFLAVKPFQTVTFLDIAVSRDFCVFCILEAARGKFKEAVVGIKVVQIQRDSSRANSKRQ